MTFFYRLGLYIVLAAILGGCTTARQTQPDETATQQLLISRAADRAAEGMQLDLPANTPVMIQAPELDGPAYQYAIGTIKEALLKQELRVVNEKSDAEVVLEIRSGALSIDETKTLLGTPSFQVPLPFTAAPEIPEIALFKKAQQRGIAKLAVTAYKVDDGSYLASTSPTYGFSHRTRWTVLIFINWISSDLIPPEKREDQDESWIPGI